MRVNKNSLDWMEIGHFRILPVRTRQEAEKSLGLSSREVEFLLLLAQGHTLKIIADLMTISHHTADTHKRRVYEKLGVNSAAQAVLIAVAFFSGAVIELKSSHKSSLPSTENERPDNLTA